MRKSLSTKISQQSEIPALKQLVDDRLFAAYVQIAIKYMAAFKKDKDYHHLREMCDILVRANGIRPDIYIFNMNMAYAYIII